VRWLPIRWRLTLFYTVTMLVIVFGLILAMYAILGVEQERRLHDQVSDCAWIGEAMIRDRGKLDVDQLNSSNCSGIAYAALDEHGRVLDQVGSVAVEGEVFPDDLWREVLQSGTAADARLMATSASDHDPRFGYAIPINIEGTPIRVIVASAPYGATGPDLLFIVPTVIAGVAIFALILIIVASWFLVRSSLAPVNAITTTARQISSSDLSQRLPVENPRDELGRLSMTINELLDRLEVAFHQREQALEDQRRFVADASHELRTPLTSILGYTRMLRQWGLDHPETAQESVAAVEQEAERMHGLVESLLRLARGEELPAMHLVPVDLRTVISDAVEAARSFGGGEQSIAIEVPHEPVLATIDRQMMIQVLELLLDNAIKYASAPGPITVSLSIVGERHVIRIADRGPGIAPGHLPHLFDRFYRAEESRTTRGSGLGLAIARQIVEQHHGTITVESEIGTGTTFTITLPYAM